MAYKRYIKRGGKLYGPYVYHSRKQDGSVISEYRGKHHKDWAIASLIIGLSLLFLLIFISTFGPTKIINPFGLIVSEDIKDIETVESENTVSIRFVIELSGAEHLDSNKEFISDIYEETKKLDDIWSEPVSDEEYARVIFEQQLTSKNDITIYPRVVDGNPRIEVYEENENNLIAEFSNINSNEYNKVFLTSLQGIQDTFDLKVLDGSLEFDYIFDPFVNLTVTSCDADDVASTPCFDAISADGGTSFVIAKGKHIDAPFQTQGDVSTVNSATLFYDSSGILSGDWAVFVTDTRDGTTICSVDPAPEDASETRNSLVCNSITPTQLANGVWLRMNNNDAGGPQDITIDYVYLDVNYSGVDNPPKWFDNSTNSTAAGEAVEHRVRWTDETNLAGYIFSFDNGAGTFVNDSFVSMTGTNNWSNVTKVVNSTEGSTIRWRVYANDSTNQFNVTDIFAYTTTSDNPPAWQFPSVNDSTPLPNRAVRHNINWTDDTALSYATLEVNGTEASCNTAANVSETTISGGSSWANLTWLVPNACEGKAIGWKQWANDSAGQWNVTDLQTYTVNNIAPNASFGTNPVDNFNSSSGIITFDLKVSDNLNVDALRLYGNWSGSWVANQTNMTAINDSYWNITVTGIPDGYYVWAAWGNDTLGNEDFTDTNRTFTIDTTNPNINFVAPTPDNNTNQTEDYVYVNVSTSDASEHSAFIDWNKSLELWASFDFFNTTGVFDNSTYDKFGTFNGNLGTNNITEGKRGKALEFNRADLDNYVNFGNDSTVGMGNVSFTVSIWFKPTGLVGGSNHDLVNRYQNHTTGYRSYSLFVDGENPWPVWWCLYSGNPAIGSCLFSSGLSNNNWYHLVGTYNTTETRLYVNGVLESSNSSYGFGTLYAPEINITVGGSPEVLDWAGGFIDEVMIFNRTLSPEEVNASYQAGTYGLSNNFTNLADGDYTFKAHVIDAVGNINETEERTIGVDATPPQIEFVAPTEANGTSVNQDYVFVNVSVTEVNFKNITYALHNGSGVVNETTYTTLITTINWTSLNNSGVDYFYNVTIYDTVNNTNKTETRKITLITADTTPPVITIISPTNSTFATGSIDYNITVDESLTNALASVDGLANMTLTNDSTTNFFNLSGDHPILTDGLHNITFYANDTVGNDNFSTIFFTVDTTNPNIDFVSPTESNNSQLTRDYIQANVTASDTNLDIITIFLYNSTGLVQQNISSTTPFFVNFTSLPDENYYLNSTANDTVGNENQTETRTITIDTINPQIQFVSPTPPNATTTANTSVEINVTITELNLNEVKFNWNSTNYTIYNDSLVLMMNFDNISALGENDTFVVDLSKYGNDGTVSGATFNSSGRYNGAFDFDGVNDFINVSDIDLTEFTLEAWVNFDSLEELAQDTIVGKSGGGGGFALLKRSGANNAFAVWEGTNVLLSSTLATTVRWYHVVGTHNGSTLRIYIDGIEENSGSAAAIVQSDNNVFIGDIGDGSQKLNGSIDEVRIWNRSLSATEIQQQYFSNLRKYDTDKWILYTNQSKNSTDGLDAGTYTYFSTANDIAGNTNQTETREINIDTIPPNIDFVAPTEANDSSLTRDYIQVNVTATDSVDIITIFLYNSTGLVTQNTSSTSPFFSNFTELPDEVYFFNSTVNDTLGNENSTVTRTVTTDTGPPAMNYVSPITATGNYSQNFIEINVTASDPKLDKILIRLYNSSDEQINSSLTSTSPNFINFTGLSDGLYFYNATANDTFSNEADLATVSVTLDTTNPSLDSLTESPSDPTMYVQGTTYEFNATITDDNLDVVLIEFDGTNYTPTNLFGNVYNFTISDLAAGTYNYRWYANDTVNNVNSTSIQTYTISNATGDITLLINGSAANQIAPYNTQTNASAATQFGVVTLYRNATDVTGDNNVFVTLGVEYYNYTAVSSGDQNHSSASITRFVTITKISSEVNLTLNVTDGNVTIVQDSFIYLNATTATGDSGATLKLYNAGTLINQGASPLSNFTQFSSVGIFNITGIYEESQNFTGSFETWYVNVTEAPDETNPGVSSLTENPSDPAVYSEGTIYEFNATITDNRVVDTVIIDFNGTNYTAVNLTGNIYNLTLTGLSVGTYNYRWYANDTSGNINSTENGSYTIDQGTPSISLSITPSNTVTYLTETTANGTGCPSQLTCTLYRDSISVGNSETATLGVGTYNYTFNTTGNINYTSASVSEILTVNQATGVVFTYLNNSRANITINQNEEIYLNSTLDTGTGTIELYNNGTLINQGTSPLSNLTNFTDFGLFNITTIYGGNTNYTSAIEIWWVNVLEVDLTPPNVSLVEPQNISYTSVQTQLNYTAVDNQALDVCWYSIDGGATNTTISCGVNVTGLDSGQGSQTWRIYANDTSGNENSSSVTFFVDSINPLIDFVTPTLENGLSIKENSVYVNVSTSDTNDHSAFIDWNYSLVGWWNFETVLSNGTVYDNSSYGNDGTMISFSSNTTIDGKYGKGIEFDGVDDSINITGLTLSNEDQITTEFWVKPDALIHQKDFLGWWDGSNGFFVEITGVTGKILTQIGAGSDFGTTDNNVIAVGNWYHIISVYDGTQVADADQLKIYVNGVNEPLAFTGDIPTTITSTSDLLIGNLPSFSRYFNGSIDEVRIHNRALSQAEINASYNAGLYSLYNNFTNLNAGTYDYKAYVIDIAGNTNQTETRNVSLVAPNLTIIKPENETYITNESLLLEYVASLEDFVFYNIDNIPPNTTITGNTTFNTTEGQHTLKLYANNSNGETVKNVTFTVNITKFSVIFDEFGGLLKGLSTAFNQTSHEDLQNLSGIILERINAGKINFNEAINVTDDLNLTNNKVDLDIHVNISSNRIELNSTALPNFNKSATLSLYNLTFTTPRILRDGSLCSSSICTQNSYSGGTLSFNVTGFTVYSAEETPVDDDAGDDVDDAGGGGGSSSSVECLNDSSCSADEACFNYQCIKLFDVKIIDFESPVRLGEFFEFVYFIKGVAEINADVVVNFWIEKDGEIVTSGLDTIYLGSFEEKTETTRIFLPSSIESGIYTFVVEVDHESYSARSERTIEVRVEGGIAIITSKDVEGIRVYAIITLIILAVIITFLIFYLERKKIKVGLVRETRWIKKHKISVLAFSLFVVLGVLTYFLNIFSFLSSIVKSTAFNYFLKTLFVLFVFFIIVFIINKTNFFQRFKSWMAERGAINRLRRARRRETERLKRERKRLKARRVIKVKPKIKSLVERPRQRGQFKKIFIRIISSISGFIENVVIALSRFSGKVFRAIKIFSRAIRKRTIILFRGLKHLEITPVKFDLSGLFKFKLRGERTHIEKKKKFKPVKKPKQKLRIELGRLRIGFKVKRILNAIYISINRFYKRFKRQAKELDRFLLKAIRRVSERQDILGLGADQKIKAFWEVGRKPVKEIKKPIKKIRKGVEKGFSFTSLIRKLTRPLRLFISKGEKELAKEERIISRRAGAAIERIHRNTFYLLKKIFGKKSQEFLLRDFEKAFVEPGKFTKRHLKTLRDIINAHIEFKTTKSNLYYNINEIEKEAKVLIRDLIDYLEESNTEEKKRIKEEVDQYMKAPATIKRLYRKAFRKTDSGETKEKQETYKPQLPELESDEEAMEELIGEEGEKIEKPGESEEKPDEESDKKEGYGFDIS